MQVQLTRRSFVQATVVATVAAGTSSAVLALASESPDATFVAGTYEAAAEGMLGEVRVEVTFSDVAIESVTVVENPDSPLIGQTAGEILPERIVASQSLDVEAVSGATVTSAAILAAVGDCVGQAGGDTSALAAAPVEDEVTNEEISCDVLVIGSGIAGLTAATAAANAGANVVIVEKQDIIGGTSAMAEGYFFSTNESDAEGLYQLFLARASKAHSDEFPEDAMLRVLADNNLAALDMIRAAGVSILPLKENTDIVASDEGIADASARSAHNLVSGLVSHLEGLGVRICTGMPATRLLTEGGAVTGATCVATDGSTLTVGAKATVIASGDYARNAEMMAELIPQSAACVTITAVGNVGDGITLAESVGGAAYPDQYVQGGPLIFDPTDVWRGSYSSPAFPKACLIVSLDGDRRMGEDQGTRPIHYSYTNHDVPDGAWCVMDSAVAATVTGISGEPVDVDALVDETTPDSPVQAYRANSVFQLALVTGMNPEVLIRNFERYQAFCEAGVDDDFGKAAEFLQPLEQAPYYALRGYAINRGTLGGVMIDEEARLTTAEGEVIPGVWAAGVIASRPFFSRTYDGGSALGIGATMGYVAGTSAAASL